MMEDFRGRRLFKSPARFSTSKGHSGEPWHSTPVKKNLFAASGTPEVSFRDEGLRSKPAAMGLHDLSKTATTLSFAQDSQAPVNGVEVSTIQRQRQELQLIMAELKNRDEELNTMTAAHQKQMQIWEQDQQRLLVLEKKCVRLEGELEKRNDVIRALSTRLKEALFREKQSAKEQSNTQLQLHELSQKQLNTSRHEQDLQERNESLKSTVRIMSSKVGQLQVQEEELCSMLKLKEKDVSDATNQIMELSGRLSEMEKTLEELRTRESIALREGEEHKHRLRKCRYENIKLKDVLQKKTIESDTQREELLRLKQENEQLKTEISTLEQQMLSEDKSWRDDLLRLSRSKQNRAESELLCLRQVCENQQNDLQLMKLNLESAREALRHHGSQMSHFRTDSGLADSNHQGQDTELETGLISTACFNTSTNASLVVSQQDCAETQTYSEQDCRRQEPVEQSDVKQKSEVKQQASDPPAEVPAHSDISLDLMAVIEFEMASGTPVSVLDVDISPWHSRASDLLLQLDCPSFSHRSGRSSVCVHDSTVNNECCDDEEGYGSSTSRLQHHLSESPDIMETLPRSSTKKYQSQAGIDVESIGDDDSQKQERREHGSQTDNRQ